MNKLRALSTVAIGVSMCVGLAGSTAVYGQPAPASPARHMSLREVALPNKRATLANFMQRVNGTWILEKRTNADGTEHKQPLQGKTVIDLKLQQSTLLGSLAVGAITAVESGTLDSRWGATVPPESRDQPFRTESSGSWQVYLDPGDKDDNVVTVVDNSTVLANYRPFQRGLRGEAISKFRVDPNPPPAPRAKRARGMPPTRTTVELVTPSVSRNIARTIAGEAIPEEELRLTGSCNCTGLKIGDDVMEITWSSGAKDIWRRERG